MIVYHTEYTTLSSDVFCDISFSHGGEYEDDSLLEYSAV
jgi:hypothetical protein